MADRKRLVTLNALVPGAPTTLKDLDDGANYASVRGSFQVKQGQRRQSVAQRSTRYGGGLVASEASENDTVTWKALVKGSTADAVLANAEAMLAVTERPTSDTFVEWRPDGASKSSYYRIMGPAAFDLTYEWAQFAGSKSMYVDVSFPVEPLARGDMAIRAFPQGTLPGMVTAPPNPSFEYGKSTDGLFGWAVTGTMGSSAATRWTGWTQSGSYSARVSGTATASNQYVVLYMTTQDAPFLAVNPGQSYQASVYAYVATALANATLYLEIVWFDAFANYISAVDSASVSAASGGGKGQVSVTATAPAGAVSAQLQLFVKAGSTTGAVAVAFDDVYWNGGINVPGTAPALADFQVQVLAPNPMPAWALVAWHPKLSLGAGLAQPPFGLFPAADSVLSSMYAVVEGDSRAGRTAWVTSDKSASGSGSVRFPVYSPAMTPDDFSQNTIDIEVWARIVISAPLISPKATLSAFSDSYLGRGGPVQYSAEYGSGGKLLVQQPSGGTLRRMSRLGTVTLPVGANAESHHINVTLSWVGGSSGAFGLDYIICVPARSRAVSPSGLALDSSYPRFLPSTVGYTQKVVRSDLSGGLSYGGNWPPYLGADAGLGGSPIELPPGEVDVFVAMDSQVPDDPTSNTATSSNGMSWFVDLAGPRMYVTPRYNLAAS